MLDPTSIKNPATASRENQLKLRSSDNWKSSGQHSSSIARKDEANDAEFWCENRAKRMRISLDDLASLESEQSRNTKPIMIGRAEVPNELSMSEKEHQKSLLTKFTKNRKVPCSNLSQDRSDLVEDTSSGFSPCSSSLRHNLRSQISYNDVGKASFTESENSIQTEKKISEHDVPLKHSLKKKVNVNTISKGPTLSRITPPPSLRRDASSTITSMKHGSRLLSKTAFRSFLSTPGYLADQRRPNSNSLSTPSYSKTRLFATPPVSVLKTPLSCPERINSIINTPSPKVRLSLSLDGKAELVTQQTWSPLIRKARPKPASGNLSTQKRSGSLRRCKSEILSCTHRTRMAQLNNSLMSSRPIGRSRNALSWARCCDGQSFDELTRQAENESIGSAVAAISLIRSIGSPSKISTPTKSRNNFTTKLEILSNKKTRFSSKTLDQAKLQQTTPSPFTLNTYHFDYVKDSFLTSPSGDSDKENWFPLQNGSPRRRPLSSSRQDKSSNCRRILYDNNNMPSHDVDLETPRGPKRKLNDPTVGVCNNHAQIKFARDVKKLVNGDMSSCKTGDLGAIQGLLSLRQGNWR